MRSVLGVDGIAREVEEDPLPTPMPEGCAFVIEGYPRSANTFAILSFERCNPGVVVDHHNHHPDAVRRAVLAGIPALVLIRDPLDACASFCVYNPDLSPERALRRWRRFYSGLEGVLGSILLVSFEDAITPRLHGAFVSAGFKARPAGVAWEDHRDSILAELRTRSGVGQGQGADAVLRVRQLQAPSFARRELLHDARELVRHNIEYAETMDLYDSLAWKL